MSEELHITDLKSRLGVPASTSLALDDQLRWAQHAQRLEPRSPWRMRIYALLTDHDIQTDWLGIERGLADALLEDFNTEVLTERMTAGKLNEYLVDLGCWHEPGASINYWLHKHRILDRTVGSGSRNPYHQPSMTTAECRLAFEKGRHLAEQESLVGSLWIGLRLVNPASAVFSAMQLFLHAGLRFDHLFKELVEPERLEGLAYVAEKAVRRHPTSRDPFMALTFFGGYDLAFAVGCIVGMATEGRFTLMQGLDGAAAAYLAELLQPGSSQYVTLSGRVPQQWREESPSSFDLPAVFSSTTVREADIHMRLALYHLHSALRA